MLVLGRVMRKMGGAQVLLSKIISRRKVVGFLQIPFIRLAFVGKCEGQILDS